MKLFVCILEHICQVVELLLDPMRLLQPKCLFKLDVHAFLKTTWQIKAFSDTFKIFVIIRNRNCKCMLFSIVQLAIVLDRNIYLENISLFPSYS